MHNAILQIFCRRFNASWAKSFNGKKLRLLSSIFSSRNFGWRKISKSLYVLNYFFFVFTYFFTKIKLMSLQNYTKKSQFFEPVYSQRFQVFGIFPDTPLRKVRAELTVPVFFKSSIRLILVFFHRLHVWYEALTKIYSSIFFHTWWSFLVQT